MHAQLQPRDVRVTHDVALGARRQRVHGAGRGDPRSLRGGHSLAITVSVRGHTGVTWRPDVY
jgi:hypothetical protein